METAEITQTVINLLLGGGLAAVLTLDLTRRTKRAEAETLDLENTHKALELYKQFFADPLNIQIEELRKKVTTIEKELDIMRAAVAKAHGCGRRGCPVLDFLRQQGAGYADAPPDRGANADGNAYGAADD